MTEMGEIGGKRGWLKTGESSSCAQGDLMVLHCKKLSHWKFQLYCTAVHQHFFQVSASGEPSSGHSPSFVGEELGCSFLCYQLSLLKGPSQWMEYHSWNGMDRLGAPSTAQAQGELPHSWCGFERPWRWEEGGGQLGPQVIDSMFSVRAHLKQSLEERNKVTIKSEDNLLKASCNIRILCWWIGEDVLGAS